MRHLLSLALLSAPNPFAHTASHFVLLPEVFDSKSDYVPGNY